MTDGAAANELRSAHSKVTAALAKRVEILDFDRRLDEADEVLLRRRRFDALRPLLNPQVLDAHGAPAAVSAQPPRKQYVLVRFAEQRGGARAGADDAAAEIFKLTVDSVQNSALTAPLVAHLAPCSSASGACAGRPSMRVTRNADISVRDIMDRVRRGPARRDGQLLRRQRRQASARAGAGPHLGRDARALVRELLGLPRRRQLFVTKRADGPVVRAHDAGNSTSQG